MQNVSHLELLIMKWVGAVIYSYTTSFPCLLVSKFYSSVMHLEWMSINCFFWMSDLHLHESFIGVE